jgi:subtilisin family serine protease
MDAKHFSKLLEWPVPSGTGPIKPTIKPDRGHLDYNMILTAHRDDFDELEKALGDPQPKFVDRIVLEELSPPAVWENLPALQGYKDVEIRLYDLYDLSTNKEEDEKFVWNAIRNMTVEATKANKIAFADPNFVTGDPGPGSGGGGSGGVGGGPGGPIGGRATRLDFIGNWAFKPFHGIFLEDGQGRRLTEFTGQGIYVYIFDSVDRRLEYGINRPEEDAQYPKERGPVQLPRGLPKELEMYLSSPSARYNQDKSARVVQIQSPDDLHDVDEHGVYVAGLIHRVAPDCQLHLVDVLNRRGQGELFGLLRALFLVAKRGAETVTKKTPSPLNNVVINLSLGASVAENAAKISRFPEALRDLRKKLNETGAANTNQALFRILEDMVNDYHYVGSLRLITKILGELGAMIVAASGNDSAKEVGNLRSQIPGRYPEVISVAASTSKGEKANFSNHGNLMAPGGGKAAPDQENDDIAKKGMSQSELEEFAVISIVPKIDSTDTGFAYWQGTSFATPLVTGVAALMLEKCLRSGDTLEPKEIKDLMLQHSRDGVINVLTTLAAISHKAASLEK